MHKCVAKNQMLANVSRRISFKPITLITSCIPINIAYLLIQIANYMPINTKNLLLFVLFSFLFVCLLIVVVEYFSFFSLEPEVVS